MALGALLVLSAALGLPAGTTCSYDAATATVQAQMVSARTVVANAGDGRILVDGRVVLRGMAGDDVLSDRRSGHDGLACGPGFDTVGARSRATVTGCERSLPRRHP